VLNRLRSAPEHWRLGYLALALFLAAPALFIAGPVLWPVEPLMLVASILVARAALARLAEYDEPVGARRWLLYPPLVAAYLALAVVLLLWPALFAVVAANDVPAVRDFLSRILTGSSSAARLGAAAVLGLWWLLLGLGLVARTATVRLTFYPFCEGFGRRHAIGVATAGFLVTGVSGILLALSGTW
jgi:hypothetical protein